MTKAKLDDAVREAHRFIEAAKAMGVRFQNCPTPSWHCAVSGTKEAGACKRASLDLTRALAELRKP